MTDEGVIIREGIKSDVNGILRIIREYQGYDVEFARRYYRRFFSNKWDELTGQDRVYVALLGEELAGAIGYCRDYFATDYSYWLGWFAVKAGHRRNKIGTRLLGRVEEDLRTMEKRRLFVSTEDHNTTAKSFYTKNGFRTEGVIRDYYDNGKDRLIMSKAIF